MPGANYTKYLPVVVLQRQSGVYTKVKVKVRARTVQECEDRVSGLNNGHDRMSSVKVTLNFIAKICNLCRSR
jgi:hypothetical protein